MLNAPLKFIDPTGHIQFVIGPEAFEIFKIWIDKSILPYQTTLNVGIAATGAFVAGAVGIPAGIVCGATAGAVTLGLGAAPSAWLCGGVDGLGGLIVGAGIGYFASGGPLVGRMRALQERLLEAMALAEANFTPLTIELEVLSGASGILANLYWDYEQGREGIGITDQEILDMILEWLRQLRGLPSVVTIGV